MLAREPIELGLERLASNGGGQSYGRVLGQHGQALLVILIEGIVRVITPGIEHSKARDRIGELQALLRWRHLHEDWLLAMPASRY